MKLVIDKGRWATKDNDMIFSNIVWLVGMEDINLYHLIDENNEEIKLPKPIEEYVIYDT